MISSTDPRLKYFDLARSNGRILIDGGLYTPIREAGLIVGFEPTPLLLELFDSPPTTEKLFDVLLAFVTYYNGGTFDITRTRNELIALGMRRGEAAALYRAVRRG